MILTLIVLLLYVLPIILIIDTIRISLKSGNESVMVFELIILSAITLIPIINIFLCLGFIKNVLQDFNNEDLQKLSWFGFLFKQVKL